MRSALLLIALIGVAGVMLGCGNTNTQSQGDPAARGDTALPPSGEGHAAGTVVLGAD